MTIQGVRRLAVVFLGLASLAASTSACGGGSRSTPGSITIRFPQAVNESHPRLQVIRRFGERLAQETGGRLKVQSFPGGTLYGAREAVRSAAVGDVEMALEPETHFITFDQGFRALDVPFQFDTPEAFQQFLGGPFKIRVEPSLHKAGLSLVAFWDEGPMILGGSKLMKTPEDFRGVKIRSSGHDLLARSFNELGAATINIPIHEVYTALSQGVAGATYTTFNTFVAGKTYEVAPKVVLWPSRSVYVWVVNRAFFEQLSEADRATIARLAADATAEYTRAIWGNYDDLVKTVRGAKDGEFHALAPADLEVFKARLKPLLDGWHAEFGAVLGATAPAP